MFTWSYSETVEVSVEPAHIWALWSKPESWPEWDKEIDWVAMKGPFIVGSKGRMKPKKGPEVGFELIQVVSNRSFVDRAQLPLTRLDFGHEYILPRKAGESAHITHTVEFRGLLAPLFGFLIGRNIKSHLRDAMLELAKLAQPSNSTLPNSTGDAAC
jgi:hypothetical protein